MLDLQRRKDRRVVLRADAHAAIGYGHAMRSVALGAELFRRGWKVSWLTSSADDFLIRRAQSAEIEVHQYLTLAADTRDAEQVARMAPDLVVVDGYHFRGRYLETLTSRAIPYVLIDDSGMEDAASAALVVNPNPHATPALYPGIDRSTLLLGLQYALIREEVRTARCVPRHREAVAPPTVLVAVGGTDVQGLNEPIASALARTRCCAVVSTSHCHASGVQRAPADIAEALAGATVAVIGGGGTLAEACCLGVPSLSLIVADNQLPGATAFAARGATVCMDAREGVGIDEVIVAVISLLDDRERLQAMAVAGRRLVDGSGVERVADVLETVLSQ